MWLNQGFPQSNFPPPYGFPPPVTVPGASSRASPIPWAVSGGSTVPSAIKTYT
jgi:hypothetical protein